MCCDHLFEGGHAVQVLVYVEASSPMSEGYPERAAQLGKIEVAVRIAEIHPDRLPVLEEVSYRVVLHEKQDLLEDRAQLVRLHGPEDLDVVFGP